jgi:hypothetical protein
MQFSFSHIPFAADAVESKLDKFIRRYITRVDSVSLKNGNKRKRSDHHLSTLFKCGAERLERPPHYL